MSRDFSVISGFSFIVDNMIQIWQNGVYLQGLGRNILSQNFTESIKKLFVLRHYFLIPTSTENNLILFIYHSNTRQGYESTVFVVVESRSILCSSKTFSCIWVTRVEKLNMTQSFCWHCLSVSCNCMGCTPHFFQLCVQYTENQTIPFHMWIRNTVRNVDPLHLTFSFSGGSVPLLH